ncbi:MAG: carotenoid oxygenase family protein [Cyclobacteriaceae bacterium]|nr:carotenoid oxygenase family protein [Cyclobacteriaceae bacterium]MCH8514852.1 carotenoid oxygenase family protein [Cyclobacteriaceae bacterium]
MNNSAKELSASRESLDTALEVIEGQLPTDLYGSVYFNSSVGSVNSGGLPYPKTKANGKPNREYGTPIMNGDGYLIKLSFDQGKAHLKSSLLMPPCYFADEALKEGSEARKNRSFKNFAFRNFGISRMSLMLGARNPCNTAVVPFRFKDQPIQLLATYDVGRPYLVQPKSLNIKSPLGKLNEWKAGTPAFLNMPFKLIQSTAHPAFDPETEELFTVNFTKSVQTMLGSFHMIEMLLEDEQLVKSRLIQLIRDHERSGDNHFSLNRKVSLFFSEPERFDPQLTGRFRTRFWNWLKHVVTRWLKSYTSTRDGVEILRWDGGASLDRWEVLDEDGKPLSIIQCMHQISFSKDYIVLIDASFKFSLDLLVSNPFPGDFEIDRKIRDILSRPMLSYVPTYIVRRADLQKGVKSVRAIKVKDGLPVEAVHFSMDYDNPDGKITLHVAHNSASCLAEWIRPYDKSAFPSHQAVSEDIVSMFALGDMDVGRIGKYVIDATSGDFVSKDQIISPKASEQYDEKMPHTFGLNFHTYRGIYDTHKNVSEIKNIFWQSYGLDSRLLSQFIFDLYKDYPNRLISLEDMMRFTQNGVPFCLLRTNTDSLAIEDYYLFEAGENLRSLQFCPKKGSTNEEDLSGYIVTLMALKQADDSFEHECWIFDASQLKSGPITKLSAEGLVFSNTVHSAWINEAVDYSYGYLIDQKKELENAVNGIIIGSRKRRINKFMKQYVYPNI